MAEAVEFEAKGGVVVASSAEGLAALEKFAVQQRDAGVDARAVTADELYGLEPELAPECRAASTTRRTPR